MTDTIKTRTAYTHCIFDSNSGKTISWHKSQVEADKALERWKARCKRRGINCSATTMKMDEAEIEVKI